MKEIQDIVVTRKMVYSPEAYLEYCKENGELPTQEGFGDYIGQDQIDEDFSNGLGVEEVTFGDDMIVVEVLGGVAECNDPRVKIIDHDNQYINML